ncbi:MAG: YgjV family protein [Clostridia bacterium]|nr:YgjV family protein [Clostridia bacterium]
MDYILSQVFVVLCYIALACSCLVKTRKTILIFSMFALAFNGASYVLLKAWMGFGVVCIAVVRNIIFMIQEKYDKDDSYAWWEYVVLVFLIAVSVAVGIIAYDGFFSLFSLLSSVIYTVSIWQKNVGVYKYLGVASSVASIIYFAFIRSLFGFILETVMLGFLIAGIIKYRLENKKKKEVDANGTL